MAYVTTLKAAQISGLAVEVFNESVGVGDGANKSFELDNGNVLAASYTLKCSASGNDENSFTSLVETTDYVLEKDGGTVLLTAAGVTLLGTKNLYASYVYVGKMSNTQFTTYLDSASNEVDKLTGNYWGSAKVSYELFDYFLDDYPTTDEPFMHDYDSKPEFQLSKRGVQSVRGVYYLNTGVSIGKAWSYASAAYVDRTVEVNSRSGASFNPFSASTVANDYFYVGVGAMFHSLHFILDVVGVTTGTNTIEYYNGSGWTAFVPTQSTTDVLNFEASGNLSWNTLAGWTVTSVNSSSSLYWVRIKAGGVYTTEAKILTAYPGQEFVVGQEVALYNVQFDSNGRVVITGGRPPTGQMNVRIDYQHGYSTVPDEIQELTALLAGIRAYVNISGGSYDDATGFTLGRLQVQIGEAWVNIREVLDQAKKRVSEILDAFGRKLECV